jgi:hypothetical protein
MPILTTNCAAAGLGCHGDAADPSLNPGGRPYLGPGTPTTDSSTLSKVVMGLVNVASNEDPSMPYITPNSPANSYLWHKVTGDLSSLQCKAGASGVAQACGTQMPVAPQLSASDLATIQSWINAGATTN